MEDALTAGKMDLVPRDLRWIQRPCDDGDAARGGTATTKGHDMTYATDFLRGDMQGLTMRLLAGKISDRERENLQELIDFFQEHGGDDGFPCQWERCTLLLVI